MPRAKKPELYTIGHSTRTFDEFSELLHEYGIKELVDVRSVPRSRHTPQFNSDTLAASLGNSGVRYTHLRELGGLRHTKKDSKNTGWRNASFRGYADYMATPEFKAGLEKLMGIAGEHRTAIMCAEAVPWRCHRSLIGDALTVQGWSVKDIMSRTSATPHRRTPFLKVRKGLLTYPPLAVSKSLSARKNTNRARGISRSR